MERVLAETDGRGADAVILAVGGNALIRTAMDAARPGGKVMLFAQTQHGEATIDPAAVCVDEKTLLGSYSSSFPILDEVTGLVFCGLPQRIRFDPTDFPPFPAGAGRCGDRNRFASQPGSMKIMIEPAPGGGSTLRRDLMATTMKAAVLHGREDVRIERVPVPRGRVRAS